MAKARLQLTEAQAAVLAPLRKRLQDMLEQIEQPGGSFIPDQTKSALAQLGAELPAMLRDLNADPATAKVLEDTFSAALASGLSKVESGKLKVNP
jgi:Tfp pilus assembly protein PilO